MTLYEALGQVDCLVSDISSVYVDYLCLDRPIIFFFPDLEAYRKYEGFAFEPIVDWLPGRLCSTLPQLFGALLDLSEGNDAYGVKRRQLAGILNPQRAPDATSRLFNLVATELGLIVPVVPAEQTTRFPGASH